MNKKVYISIIVFILLFSLHANGYNLFNYYRLDEVDYYTGQSFSHFSNEGIENKRDKVKSVEIIINSDKSVNSINFKYLKGKLESINSTNRDGRNSYFKYNSDGYLENVDFQKRTYPSKNKCILIEDEKIEFIISINEKDDSKEILFERPLKNSDKYYLSQIFEYSYKNEVLDKYTMTYINPKGNVYSKRDYSFEYDDDLLKSYSIIVNDELRWEYSFSYNKELQLVEVLYNDYKNQNNRRKTFFDFDAYGNWTGSEEYYNSVLISVISRVILYEEK